MVEIGLFFKENCYKKRRNTRSFIITRGDTVFNLRCHNIILRLAQANS